ncbi:MAG: hypothetical protein P4L31_07165, partial [Candidatus Babeliales bacterium]|nr:hypothetical protein [Candidatus Babeliales bacterium]
SFKKGYKPKFSKSIHEVTSKDEHYYYVDHELKRGYFRSNLQLVSAVELNPHPPDLENTLEGRLKVRKQKENQYVIPETNLEERKRQPKRERRPVPHLDEI